MPVQFAHAFTQRINTLQPPCSVVTILARREYEAWFLASLDSIAGHTLKGRPGLPSSITYTGDVETVRGAKEWLTAQLPMGQSYKEAEDQATMTSWLDITAVYERSRSFRRLYHAVEEIVQAMDNGIIAVTPAPQD